jgi:hypothetical protein
MGVQGARVILAEMVEWARYCQQNEKGANTG